MKTAYEVWDSHGKRYGSYRSYRAAAAKVEQLEQQAKLHGWRVHYTIEMVYI